MSMSVCSKDPFFRFGMKIEFYPNRTTRVYMSRGAHTTATHIHPCGPLLYPWVAIAYHFISSLHLPCTTAICFSLLQYSRRSTVHPHRSLHALLLPGIMSVHLCTYRPSEAMMMMIVAMTQKISVVHQINTVTIRYSSGAVQFSSTPRCSLY